MCKWEPCNLAHIDGISQSLRSVSGLMVRISFKKAKCNDFSTMMDGVSTYVTQEMMFPYFQNAAGMLRCGLVFLCMCATT